MGNEAQVKGKLVRLFEGRFGRLVLTELAPHDQLQALADPAIVMAQGDGEVRFLNEDHTVVAPPGTFAAMTRGHLHAFWNASDRPARLLMAVAPGEFATFFDEVVAELRASKSLTPATVGETMERFAKKHNIVMYPDRVPEEAKPFLPR